MTRASAHSTHAGTSMRSSRATSPGSRRSRSTKCEAVDIGAVVEVRRAAPSRSPDRRTCAPRARRAASRARRRAARPRPRAGTCSDFGVEVILGAALTRLVPHAHERDALAARVARIWRATAEILTKLPVSTSSASVRREQTLRARVRRVDDRPAAQIERQQLGRRVAGVETRQAPSVPLADQHDVALARAQLERGLDFAPRAALARRRPATA